MIEQGDYMVVNLASRARYLSQNSAVSEAPVSIWSLEDNFSQNTSLGTVFHDSCILREV